MGVVWLARDETLNIEVALKFLPEVVALDPEAVNELKRETRRALRLTHPHIVRIYDFLEDRPLTAISMEFVSGKSLSQAKLDRPSHCFGPEELLSWLFELSSALDYAHQKARIVHRDLKPANLLITSNGDIKITDFGISANLSDTATRVSRTANVTGTPHYMSPQQMNGNTPDASDDIYALGATLYELLTSKPPFYTGNILYQVQNKTAPSVTERRAALLGAEEAANLTPIPPQWEDALAACLAKDPADRPARSC